MPNCDVPALFAGGVDDSFVGSHHAENLFNAHAGRGTRQFVRFPGDHNSIREKWFLDRAMKFLRTGPSRQSGSLSLSLSPSLCVCVLLQPYCSRGYVDVAVW